ncbi:unnamed protein product [Heligmosomoides polygyrus]|uniref:Uncharacterized protein n=1 Tax=Heligmosomoides polygyrus TaxID=6339 RepID=A0A183GU13_HELPZ|nr:unnamed protein product [Heligmosomoides polygyrus]
MAQLANREEDVNQRQLLTQIFRKFSQPIQLRILEKKSELENPKLWDWKRFHAIVDDIISKKELIEEAQITGSNTEANLHSNRNRRKETLRITTFGSSEVKEKTCDIVFVKLKDDQGKLLSFTLFKADVITNYISAPQFRKEDLKFIDQQELQLPNEALVTNPTILLGCDQL